MHPGHPGHPGGPRWSSDGSVPVRLPPTAQRLGLDWCWARLDVLTLGDVALGRLGGEAPLTPGTLLVVRVLCARRWWQRAHVAALLLHRSHLLRVAQGLDEVLALLAPVARVLLLKSVENERKRGNDNYRF